MYGRHYLNAHSICVPFGQNDRVFLWHRRTNITIAQAEYHTDAMGTLTGEGSSENTIYNEVISAVAEFETLM